MKPGETVFDSCHRLLQREVKVDVSVADLKKRLQTVGHYSFVWGKREQLPQTNGTADISVVVSLALTSSEVAAIVPDEFEHREWMSPAEILTGDFHPALKRSMQDYVQLQRFKELDALLLEGRRVKLAPEHPISDAMKALSSPAEASADAPITDAEMVAACRQFLQYHRFISQKDTESIPCKETL
jgi:hypothetical protein